MATTTQNQSCLNTLRRLTVPTVSMCTPPSTEPCRASLGHGSRRNVRRRSRGVSVSVASVVLVVLVAGGARAAASSVEPLDQAVEELRLGRHQLLPRRVYREPSGAVDVRELGGSARSGWPFHGEGVAADRVRVEVALRGPRGDHLAALLLHLAQLDQLAGGQRRAGLLLELPQGAGARILAVGVLALRDRPRAGVLARPERAAGVHEQHLGLAARDPVEEDARAAPRHGPESGRLRERHRDDRPGLYGELLPGV